MDKLNTMAGFVVEIMEKAPAAIEGGKLKALLERGKKMAANPAQEAQDSPETLKAGITPGDAFMGLYQLLQYIAQALPTITVSQAEAALKLQGFTLPKQLKDKIKDAGLTDATLNTVLLFGVPFKQKESKSI